MTPEHALERLFTADEVERAWFAPAFLAQVPFPRVEAILADVRRQGGALRHVRREADHFVVELAETTLRADVSVDAEGRFVGLLLRPGAAAAASLDDALAPFRKLPGAVSLLVTTDGVEVGSIAPDTPLAVGSAFKLAVLAAVRAAVAAKTLEWRDVIPLQDEAKSLPSGILQDFPAGTLLTVDTLASLMIAKSDNTAADTLIALVGRAAVEELAPRDRPFLTTREVFLLKSPDQKDALARFRAADEPGRRAVLDELRDAELPDPARYPRDPTAHDVEWHFSARELCALISKVQDLPPMSIDPGVAKRADWSRVAYKGGSEPGVLNLTTCVVKGTHAHCVAATWNATSNVDELRFASAYQCLLGWLATT